MNENDLLAAVLDLCRYRSLLVHHCRPARHGKDGKWRTPVQGDAGFVDLVIAGPGGVLMRELKNEIANPAPEQRQWLATLKAAGADVGIWRPRDLGSGRIARELHTLATTLANRTVFDGSRQW